MLIIQKKEIHKLTSVFSKKSNGVVCMINPVIPSAPVHFDKGLSLIEKISASHIKSLPPILISFHLSVPAAKVNWEGSCLPVYRQSLLIAYKLVSSLLLEHSSIIKGILQQLDNESKVRLVLPYKDYRW